MRSCSLFAVALLGVLFGPPALSSEYQGFTAAGYSVRAGDINGDGRLDLHLKYSPPTVPIMFDDMIIPIGQPVQVDNFVLRQSSAGGGFELQSNLTSAQLASVATWAEVAVKVIYGDFNVDGYLDILLREVSTAVLGAKDVLVFAPALKGAAPAHVRNWDQSLEWFVRDVVGWLEDQQHYYDPGLVNACVPRTVWVPVYQGDEYGNEWYRWEPITVQVCGTYLDTTNYSVPALEFLNEAVTSLRYGDLWPQIDEAPAVSQILRSVLGIPIMRGTLEDGGLDFGLHSNLQPILSGEELLEVRDSFLARLRLERLFYVLWRKLAIKAFCDTNGTPHSYSMELQVCSPGQSGCDTTNVYFNEMLFHPVTGYWDRTIRVTNGQRGYAEMACTWEIRGACDLPLPFPQVFDGGPIITFRHDPELYHRNETLRGHVFHPGWVERYSVPAPNGGVSIRTVGGGAGDCPIVNELGGIYLFWTVDRFIECHLAGGCDKKHE